MKTPAHLKGNSNSTIALLTRCNIAVCEDSRMILDSAKMYCEESESKQCLQAILAYLKEDNNIRDSQGPK